jgi:ABC-type sugar transport system ATPase subunit
MAAEYLIELEHVSKRFGGVQALQDVSVGIRPGEVHAVCGENGAGKSTLMKLLAGVHAPDSGELRLDGQAVRLSNPRDARRQGISIVFQELNLFPERSVAANIFANREWVDGIGRIRRQAMNAAAREVLTSMGVAIDPEALVGSLSIGEKQLVEIARTLQQQSRIIILDEPNSALTELESARLFEILHRLRKAGITIIYVSHRLEEVFAISDRITVIRDGRYQGTHVTTETSIPEIITTMIGRRLDQTFPSRAPIKADAQVLLQARELRGPHVGPISFDVRAGAILGFAGLEGSGVDELFSVLFGLAPLRSGELIYGERHQHPRSPQAAMRLGWGLIPASRRDQGLMMEWSVARNATLLALDKLLNPLGLIARSKVLALTKDYVARLNIAAGDLEQPIIHLSGGNQQKVLLAKWLATNPNLLILNDPTRGVDVGAKREIYRLCAELAAGGMALLISSSEIDETLGLADRVIGLHKGRAVGEFHRGAATKAEVLRAAYEG